MIAPEAVILRKRYARNCHRGRKLKSSKLILILELFLSPQFSQGGEMIAQRFGFTRDFPKEQNTGCISD